MKNTFKSLFIIAAIGMFAFVLTGCEGDTPAEPAAITGESHLAMLQSRINTHEGFYTEPLPQEYIDLLVAAGFTAPTAKNQRSIDLYVVTDREVMARMQENHNYSWGLYTAPLVIVVAGNNERGDFGILHTVDGSMAAMAMMTQATAMGLSACLVSVAPIPAHMESVAAALNMPDYMDPVAMVTFGFPTVDAWTNASASLEMQPEALHINGHGQR